MILTGSEIHREWANSRIVIDPFVPEQVNPNSYNFRLGRTLRVYREAVLDPKVPNRCDEIEIPDEGYVLEPGRLYLAHTVEVLGSDHYAPTFAARSSIARLGVFINLSASLGDIGYKGQWTLQLYAVNRVRLYAGVTIGQMMWWRPRGTVALYEGKYQGATGPRSSDIHLDFAKQLARQRLPGLGGSADPAATGPKFAELARHSREFDVPPALCVPAHEFELALSAEQRDDLAAAFADIRATVGAFFADSVARVRAVAAGVSVPAELRGLLRARLADVFGDADVPVAVRSSGLGEDTATASLAGVHHSVLNARGLDEVVAAVEACWRSHYGAPALAARIRAGDFDPAPRLAVFVQAMVAPELAGVAFTGLDEAAPDEVTVEYVTGLGDRLVAGVATPARTTSSGLPGDGEPPVLAEVVAMARALRERTGGHVDVEWAADATGVRLLQVRPLTAVRAGAGRDEAPVAVAGALYAGELPAGFHLGAVAGVYGYYVAKRAPAYRLAAAHGVAVGAAWVVNVNGRGLHDGAAAAALRAVLASGAATECVLDLGDTLRQIVVGKDEVLPRLAELTAARPQDTALHAAVVRDFIRGELGVISRLAGRGLVVEYAPEGLMALNRGTAGGRVVLVHDVDRPWDSPGNTTAGPDAAPLLPHLPELARFTAAMRAAHGAATLEWVQAGGRLYFVDYSVVAGDELTPVAGGVLISAGTARGPLLRLDDDELLSRLSIGPAVSVDRSADVTDHEGLARILARVAAVGEKPIVAASRPYAVLSVLIGHVAGFVFEQGSTLGHLAILLREAGVPAVAVGAGTAGWQGEVVVSDGTVTVTGGKGERP